jgi:hypothetical protein
MAMKAQVVNGLTCDQVCDWPMDDLLARVNGSLDTTDINEPKFFGYITVTASGRITIYTPTDTSDVTRDAAIRFLITTHLGLPTHLFPDVFQATVFYRDGKEVGA